MDGQWESNDLEAFVAEMLKLEVVKKDWMGSKRRVSLTVFSESDKKIDCFVLGKTKIDMLGWVSCLQLVFRRVNDSTDLKHFKVLGR